MMGGAEPITSPGIMKLNELPPSYENPPRTRADVDGAQVQLHQYCDECASIITPCLNCAEGETIAPFRVQLQNLFNEQNEGCHVCIILRRQFHELRLRLQHQFRKWVREMRNGKCMVEVNCRRSNTADPLAQDPSAGFVLTRRYSAFRHATRGCTFYMGIEFLVERYDIEPVRLFIEIFKAEDKVMQSFVHEAFIPARPQYNVRQVKDWLADCQLNHTECLDFNSRISDDLRMPTRIIHIGTDHVNLICDQSYPSKYPYATMSHVWGHDLLQHYNLCDGNIQQLRQGVPIQDLPHIYQEAIELARILELEYLWIDSMCILQDSKSDWEREAPLMSSVYGNATCNLACISPPDQFRTDMRADPRASLPCFLQKQTKEGESPDYSFIHGVYGIHPWTGTYDPYSYWTNSLAWPISSRAWTFQEHLLSTRTLFFGSEMLFWDCSHGFYDEWLGLCLPEITSKKAIFDSLCVNSSPRMESSMSNLQAFNHTWTSILMDYRSRYLTVPGDRVVAFAGIARALHNITQMTYLAGMWSELWLTHIIWRRDNSKNRTGPIEKLASRVPSWSWFKAPLERRVCVSFPNLASAGDGQESIMNPLASLISFQWKGYPENRLPSDSYTKFEGLQLQLRTRLITIEVSFSPSALEGDRLPWEHVKYIIEDFSLFSTIVSQKLFAPDHFWYWPDNRTIGFDNLPSTITLAPILQIERHQDYRRREISGLALEYDANLDAWSRIGVWEMCSKIEADNQGADLNDFKSPSDFEGFGEESVITLI